jgi:integrase/recombinase XerD
VTHLRRIMLEEPQRRKYSDATTRQYLRVVEELARLFGKSPNKLRLEHLRTYQAYLLKQRKLAVGTVVSQVSALRFFFVRTLKRPEFREFLPYPREHSTAESGSADEMGNVSGFATFSVTKRTTGECAQAVRACSAPDCCEWSTTERMGCGLCGS